MPGRSIPLHLVYRKSYWFRDLGDHVANREFVATDVT